MSPEVTRVVTTRPALRATYDELPAGTARAVVLTMGALHAGHAQLLREARARAGPHGHVTASVFVNPLQFSAGEDLESYPRSLQADVELCAREGVDLVFAPDVGVVYPRGEPSVTVDPGPLGTLLEGAVRPGHFRGMLTVVHKFLSMTSPTLALFGEKDYQQLVLIRQMVADLDLPVQIIGVPIVRDADGLALSSRNQLLSGAQRGVAGAVPRAIEAGRRVADGGGIGHDVVAAVHGVLDHEEGLVVDYAVVTDLMLGAPPDLGPARLLLAVSIGGVHLLDNARIDLRIAP